MTGKIISIAWALGLWAAMQLPAFGQEDTSAIGGAVDNDSYEETGAGLSVDEMYSDIWSAADSAYHIPAYETYGDWNTDQIFERRPAVTI